jgi:hemolysin III
MASKPSSQSPQEETVNAVLHLVGLVLSVAAVVLLVAMANLRGTARHIVSCSLYGGTLLFLYFSSTLYHVFPMGRAKNLFRFFDHSSVFLLIAGTYTPFTLVTLRGAWGWSLFGSIWGLTVAGILMKIFIKKQHAILSTGLYVLMGWLIVIALRPLLASLPMGGFLWLAAGGLFYTGGLVFFALDRIRYFHAIWHLFVLAGSLCHFFSVYYYVLPWAGQ